ncbi:MAG: hypothetical protein QGH94_12855 [Phycisphaerae bacterium]|jgi:hypothetical protein|nr:hypothetical protein [Phycisphaerae bacterium]
MIVAAMIGYTAYPSGFAYEMPAILTWVPLVLIALFIVSFFKWLSGRKQDLPDSLQTVGFRLVMLKIGLHNGPVREKDESNVSYRTGDESGREYPSGRQRVSSEGGGPQIACASHRARLW